MDTNYLNPLCLLIEKNCFTIAKILIKTKLTAKSGIARKLCTFALQTVLSSTNLDCNETIADFDLIKLLMDYGANIKCNGINSQNSLFFKFMSYMPFHLDFSCQGKTETELNDLYKLLDLFIQFGVDLNERDCETGETIIMKENNDKVFEILCNNGATMKNIKDNNGTPAWYHILQYITTVKSLKLLIKHADLKKNDFYYCKISKKRIDQQMKNKPKWNQDGCFQYYPLHILITDRYNQQRQKMARYLINNGFKINFTDAYGNTPLLLCNDYQTCKLLISKNANISHKNKRGLSFIQMYMYKSDTIRDINLLKLLSKYKKTNFNDTFTKDDFDLGDYDRSKEKQLKKLCNTLLMNLILQYKYKINLANDEKIIQFYCQSNKCKVNFTNNKGLTALMLAVIADRVEYVEYLIKYGCDINFRNPKNGQTAIFYAQSIKTARVLANCKKCNMKAIDNNGCNLLLNNANSIKMLQFYLSLKKVRFNINKKDKEGNNLLIKMQSIKIDHYNKFVYQRLIQQLVNKYKINVNHKNNKQQSALCVATKNKDSFKIDVLKQSNAC